MEKQSTLLPKIAYLYVSLPFLIFSVGYFKWYFALLAVGCVAYSLFLLFRHAPSVHLPDFTNKETRLKLLTVFLLICVWVYLSGIGKLSFQNTDHYWRNSIFEELVNRPWPVKTDANASYSGTIALVYYIGFWLPAALVGKAFGMQAGFLFQDVWAVVGIFLVYLLLSAINKKLSYLPLLLLVFFSGLDIAEKVFAGGGIGTDGLTAHIEWTMSPFQFSSFTTQLFWVFNQALPVWLIALLMYFQKSNRGIVFLFSLSLLSSSLPFIGLIPFLALFAFNRRYPSAVTFAQKTRAWCKDSLTFENIVGGGMVGIVTYLYLCANRSGQQWGLSLSKFYSFRGFAIAYLLFAVFEFLLYFLVIRKYQSRKPLYWVSLFTLFLCPLITVGQAAGGMDFCMRASIPALFYLLIMVADTLVQARSKKDKTCVILLAALLIIGSITPICEIVRSTSRTLSDDRNTGALDAGSFSLLTSDDVDNFIGHTQDSIFFNYIAK